MHREEQGALRYFNPHSREGSDEQGLQGPAGAKGISIHTPAKGVTSTSTPARSKFLNFNPHSREGSDCDAETCTKFESNFNPHSREGSDRWLPIRASLFLYFNPHSREGSDLTARGIAQLIAISIHTPAKGVTFLIE